MAQLAKILLAVVVAGFVSASCQPLLAQSEAEDKPGAEVTSKLESKGMFSTEVWLTPLILLPGVALLIVSTSARFSQLHTEFHRLLDHPDDHAKILSRHLLKRSRLFRDALVSLYVSVGLFAFGSLLGGVVNLWRPESLWVVGSSTMIGIGCIVFAALQLVREALICIQVVADHTEQLHHLADAKDVS